MPQAPLYPAEKKEKKAFSPVNGEQQGRGGAIKEKKNISFTIKVCCAHVLYYRMYKYSIQKYILHVLVYILLEMYL